MLIGVLCRLQVIIEMPLLLFHAHEVTTRDRSESRCRGASVEPTRRRIAGVFTEISGQIALVELVACFAHVALFVVPES